MKPACIDINYIIFVGFQLLQNVVKGFYLIFVIFDDNFLIFCEPIKMAASRPFNLNPSGTALFYFLHVKQGSLASN
jgi:hypothetical protein